MKAVCKVQKVATLKKPGSPLEEMRPHEALTILTGQEIESCSDYHSPVVPCQYHPFFAAVHAAFDQHRPLVLSPDMFWLLIMQGLARHINANSEQLRSRFVTHKGKEKIVVWRDHFIKGSPENTWTDVFDEFSDQIRGYIGDDNHRRFIHSYTSTGAVEKAAFEVTLMAAMQNYFHYIVLTMCGIPEVTLEGRPEDWKALVENTKALREYGLDTWLDRLLPHLEAVADNAAGADNPEIWKNFFKEKGGSGGPYISGWITNLLPYTQVTKTARRDTGREPNYQNLSDEERAELFSEDKIGKSGSIYHHVHTDVPNPLFELPEETLGSWENPGLTYGALPGGLSVAPFLWKYIGLEFPMEFIAGFTAFTQDPVTMAVRPKIGWAVRDAMLPSK